MFTSTLILALNLASGPLPIGTKVGDVTGRDVRGASISLADHHQRIVVVIFLGIDCPMARLYGRRLAQLAKHYGPHGVEFIGVDANANDSAAAIARFSIDFGLTFPVLKDASGEIADRFRAKRTPEVFVLDAQRRLRYRGRIDGQNEPGVQRPMSPRDDLARALDDLIAGRKVEVPVTEATGCFIARSTEPASSGAITYTRDVAPILNRRCVTCHRPGEVAPFSLLSYKQVTSWAETIREVVAQGRMPPWHANPAHGKFANDPRLTHEEKQTLNAWIAAGCPEGDPAQLPPVPKFTDGWMISPDVVVSLLTSIDLPAQGVLDIQYISVNPNFKSDVWVKAIEVRPSNRTVLHHCSVFLQRPEHAGTNRVVQAGSLQSYFVAGYAPGTPATRFPPRTAKRIPAGMNLLFQLHYVTTGKPESDLTRIGFELADVPDGKREVATLLILDEDFVIPPRASSTQVRRSRTIDRDVMLLSLFPHMHLRGKSFRYEAVYPDGRQEVLLDVPKYDFNWQNRYELAEPKLLPRGTEIICTANYDNSADNPLNPDPSAEVRAGQLSTDEMFNGYFEVVPLEGESTSRWWLWTLAVGGVAIIVIRRLHRFHRFKN